MHMTLVLGWAAVVALSWFGWGRLLVGRLGIGARADVGLCAGLGVAVTVFVGGLLNATEACSRASLGWFAVVGAGLALPPAWRGIRRAVRRRNVTGRRALPWVPVVIGGAFVVVASASWTLVGLNPMDDLPLYCVLPQRMLESGAAVDPLCIRRLLTFGGYALLQAQLGVVATAANAYLLDAGLATVLVVLLLGGVRRRRGLGRGGVCLLAAACWAFPLPRANSMAAWTTTALLLTAYRALVLADAAGAMRRRWLVLSAVAAATACTFRANVQALPPVFYAIYFGHRLLRRTEDWRRHTSELLLVVTAGTVAIAPWSVTLYRACGSPMFPLFAGNDVDGIATRAPGMDLAARLRFAAGFFLQAPVPVLCLPAVLVAIARRWTLLCLYAATLLTCGLTAAVYPLDVEDQKRFCVPLVLAAALLGLDVLFQQWRRSVAARNVALCGMAAGVALGIGPSPGLQVRRYAPAFTDAVHGPPPPVPPEKRSRYAAMQAALPPGARVATALDYLTLLDLGRCRFDSIDLPGAAAVGHFPIGGGPEALRQFLLAQGEQYLTFQDFDAATGLYSATYWRRMASYGIAGAWTMLQFQADAEALAKAGPLVYDRDGLRVVRLRRE